MTNDWEGGRRQGIRWGRVAVALVVAVSVAAVVAVARRDRGLPVDTDQGPVVVASETVEVVVTSPLEAGGRWYCPSTHPVRAFDDGLYYPVHYPHGPALAARPATCYQDAARAEEAGYDLAAPPAGAVLVGDVYLEGVQTPAAETCQDLADDLGFTVPCPRLLPTPAEALSCQTGRCAHRGGVVIEQRSFRVAVSSFGAGDTHVVITGAPLAAASEVRPGRPVVVDADEALVSCGPDDPVTPAGPDDLALCPSASPWIPGIGGFPHEDHQAAFWRRGRVVFGASIDPSVPDAGEVLRAVIGEIAYIEPRRP